ncbi:MAG TPA: hypothetical protein VG895_03035 [Patescibacteria group bacterium]|nr:hypothetical protein [Patescibacteria group bacterium]
MKLYLFFVVGFLFISLLLFLNHPGVAIRIVNWIFYLLIIAILFKLFYVEKN